MLSAVDNGSKIDLCISVTTGGKTDEIAAEFRPPSDFRRVILCLSKQTLHVAVDKSPLKKIGLTDNKRPIERYKIRVKTLEKSGGKFVGGITETPALELIPPEILIRSGIASECYKKAAAEKRFHVNRGRLCVIGAEGSGKTALIEALLGVKGHDDGMMLNTSGYCQIRTGGAMKKCDNNEADFDEDLRETICQSTVNNVLKRFKAKHHHKKGQGQGHQGHLPSITRSSKVFSTLFPLQKTNNKIHDFPASKHDDEGQGQGHFDDDDDIPQSHLSRITRLLVESRAFYNDDEFLHDVEGEDEIGVDDEDDDDEEDDDVVHEEWDKPIYTLNIWDFKGTADRHVISHFIPAQVDVY